MTINSELKNGYKLHFVSIGNDKCIRITLKDGENKYSYHAMSIQNYNRHYKNKFGEPKKVNP